MRALLGRHRVKVSRKRQRDIEIVLRYLEIGEKRRREQPLCLSCGLHGRCIVGRVVTCLQLADPISPTRVCQSRVGREVVLKSALVEFGTAKGAKLWCQSAKHPDQPELCPDHIGYETELRLLREFESGFCVTLNLWECLAACEKVCDQSAARNVRKAQVPRFLRRPERGSHQRNGRAHVACPGNNVPETQIDTRLEAAQPAVLY